MIFQKKINDKIFIADVRLLVGTHKDLRAWYDKRGIVGAREDNEYLAAMVQVVDQKINGVVNHEYLIYVEDRKDFYALMHECTHLVAGIFRDRNIPLDLTNNQELFAYYQSYWFKRLWRIMAKIK